MLQHWEKEKEQIKDRILKEKNVKTEKEYYEEFMKRHEKDKKPAKPITEAESYEAMMKKMNVNPGFRTYIVTGSTDGIGQ